MSRDNAWTDWCMFFLHSIAEQSAENEQKARAILGLYEKVKNLAIELTHSQYAIRAVDFLFQNPIFSGAHFAELSRIPKPSAARILAMLHDADLFLALRESKGRQAGVYAFRELLNVAEGQAIF